MALSPLEVWQTQEISERRALESGFYVVVEASLAMKNKPMKF